jgi:hypothetical protein
LRSFCVAFEFSLYNRTKVSPQVSPAENEREKASRVERLGRP